jgi:hypothetical protein
MTSDLRPSPREEAIHTYDIPIKDDDHALFCLREAKRRYGGELIADSLGMYVVKDGHGITHTDAVLRALSRYDRRAAVAFAKVSQATTP